jgi:hypothetical protein
MEFVGLEPWPQNVEIIECTSGGKDFDLNNAARYEAMKWVSTGQLIFEFRLLPKYLRFEPVGLLVSLRFSDVAALSVRQPLDWVPAEVDATVSWWWSAAHAASRGAIKFTAGGLSCGFSAMRVEFLNSM